MDYQERTYRNLIQDKDLVSFQILEEESDLFIRSTQNLKFFAQQALSFFRRQIKDYIAKHPLFKEILFPYPIDKSAPEIIQSMLTAASQCNVGPMAAVAGAIAEFMGRELLKYSEELIIENGGDIFLKSNKIRKVSIFAGNSPLSQKIILEIDSKKDYIGICTSSGTVEPSLSFGLADAVTVIAPSISLADAAATVIGNKIKKKEDIKDGLIFAQSIGGLKGVVILIRNKIGMWGEINLSF